MYAREERKSNGYNVTNINSFTALVETEDKAFVVKFGNNVGTCSCKS